MDRRPFRRATFRSFRGRPIVSRERRGGNSGKLVGRGKRGREAIRRATTLSVAKPVVSPTRTVRWVIKIARLVPQG